MDWVRNPQNVCLTTDFDSAVGKSGTTDSVAIISVIWLIIRIIPK